MKLGKKTKISSVVFLLMATLTSANAQWQWSDSLQTYYYRDNNGVVHYGDGSSGGQSTTWTNSEGKTVYSANSAGPADKTGQYAIQAQRIDESSVGKAPTTPPANAVAVKPGSTGGAVFGGTDTSTTRYVNPTTSNGGISAPTTATANSTASTSNSFKCVDAKTGSISYGVCSVGQLQTPVNTVNSSGQNTVGQVLNATVTNNSSTSTSARDLASLVNQVKAADTTSTGGAVFGGTPTNTSGTSSTFAIGGTPTGGAVFGGTPTNTGTTITNIKEPVVDTTSTGVAVFGGTPTNTGTKPTFAIGGTPTGGAVFGGTPTNTGTKPTFAIGGTPTGGAVFGGTPTNTSGTSSTFAIGGTPTGGAVFGGTPTNTGTTTTNIKAPVVDTTSTGGAVFGGTPTNTSGKAPVFSIGGTATGGAVFGPTNSN